jgi:hypothetical protein
MMKRLWSTMIVERFVGQRIAVPVPPSDEWFVVEQRKRMGKHETIIYTEPDFRFGFPNALKVLTYMRTIRAFRYSSIPTFHSGGVEEFSCGVRSFFCLSFGSGK